MPVLLLGALLLNCSTQSHSVKTLPVRGRVPLQHTPAAAVTEIPEGYRVELRVAWEEAWPLEFPLEAEPPLVTVKSEGREQVYSWSAPRERFLGKARSRDPSYILRVRSKDATWLLMVNAMPRSTKVWTGAAFVLFAPLYVPAGAVLLGGGGTINAMAKDPRPWVPGYGLLFRHLHWKFEALPGGEHRLTVLDAPVVLVSHPVQPLISSIWAMEARSWTLPADQWSPGMPLFLADPQGGVFQLTIPGPGGTSEAKALFPW